MKYDSMNEAKTKISKREKGKGEKEKSKRKRTVDLM
jgi:hypothetical protein